jgi:inositol phosphorylceramide mannosyltransferase catalytic subunit
MARRRYLQITLSLLAAFLVGTVIVLSTVSFYLQIDSRAFLTPAQLEEDIANNRSRPELIPRILHQTWKTAVLPEKWQGVSTNCRELMPS